MSTLKVTDIKSVNGTSALSIEDGTGIVGANKFTDLAGTGAPDFPNGLVLGSNTTGGDISGVTLDDYEEGTWTPSITSGITSPGYNVQTGRYIKIGNLVWIDGRIHIYSGTTTSNELIFSLPFTPAASGNTKFPTGTCYFNSVASNGISARPLIYGGLYFLYQKDSAPQSPFTGTMFGSSGSVNFNIVYTV